MRVRRQSEPLMELIATLPTHGLPRYGAAEHLVTTRVAGVSRQTGQTCGGSSRDGSAAGRLAAPGRTGLVAPRRSTVAALLHLPASMRRRGALLALFCLLAGEERAAQARAPPAPTAAGFRRQLVVCSSAQAAGFPRLLLGPVGPKRRRPGQPFRRI